MDQQTLEKYEPVTRQIAGCYFYLHRNKGDFGLDDLEQAGRIAVFNVSRKRPDMINVFPYVKQAIKNAIFGEMRKMWHKEKHIYLAREDEGTIQAVDVFPTREKGEKLDELEELLYQIKHQFSERESKALESLLDKCDNVYDLNLSELPPTDVKDRVKVVTRIDLTDEEMLVYAQVLLGVRGRFPNGYISDKDGRKRSRKYGLAVLDAIGISPKEFANSSDKIRFINKYKLLGFYQKTYNFRMLDFLREIDANTEVEDIFHDRRKWTEGLIPLDKISQKIKEFTKNTKKQLWEIGCRDFKQNGMRSMLKEVFGGSGRLAIEFAYPGTYPEYTKEAEKIQKEYGTGVSTIFENGGRLGFRGYKDAASYFLAHPERFSGLSRTELFQANKGLYEKLRGSGKLAEVIPVNLNEKWVKMSGKEILPIISELANKLGKPINELKFNDFRNNGLGEMLNVIFAGSSRLAIEFAYSRTYSLK